MKRAARKKVLSTCLALALVLSAVGILRPHRKTAPVWAPLRLTSRQLILDAGHGGEDGGAVSVTGVPESGINLDIVLKLDNLLGFCGVSPILLRDKDISLHDAAAQTLHEKKVSDLHNRVSTIEGTENALLVSIHQNTYPSSAYHGAQVFYREEGESRALAEVIQATLREKTDISNKRTAKKIDSGVYLMKHITCPAVLVECGFLSNPAEEARLRDSRYQTQLALCIQSTLLKNWENNGGKTQNIVI